MTTPQVTSTLDCRGLVCPMPVLKLSRAMKDLRLDRGLDRRLVLLLFFSGVEIIETHSEKGPVTTIKISNSPRDAVDIIKARKTASAGSESLLCDRQSDFERYLKLLNKVRTFFAHNYRERRLLARDLKPCTSEDSRNLQAFAALDQSKLQLVYDRDRGTYNVYSLSTEQKIAILFLRSRSLCRARIRSIRVHRLRESGTHFRPLVDWTLDDGEDEELRNWILGPLFQMTSLILHERRAHLAHMNAIGELCAQFRRGILAVLRSTGAEGTIRRVEAYHRLHPGAAAQAWHPVARGRVGDTDGQQLYVNAEHDGKVGVVTLSRES